MGGQVRGDADTGRIGQVVPERDLDVAGQVIDPDHHEAGLRHEAEQVRDEGEQRRGRVDGNGVGLHAGPSLRVLRMRVRG